MTDTKPPAPPVRTGRATDRFGGWVPSWYRPRTSWIPILPPAYGTDNEGNPIPGPAEDASVAESRRVTAASAPAAQAIGDKPVIGPPPGYEKPYADVINALSNTQSLGRSTSESVWDCLGAENTKNGRLGSTLLKGVLAQTIINAFVSANNAGKFADTHYDGTDIWFKLMYPADVDPGTGVPPSTDLPVTYDPETAYDRLVAYGIGYAGNTLDPALVDASFEAAKNPPKGYTKSDPTTVLFVFAYSLDTLPGSSLMASGPFYADVYAEMTPQQVLDHEKAARESGGGPSGFTEEPLPPAGHGKKVAKHK
ncbi:MAG: hypothetical protein IPK52_22070 [Chloroflexi bacterium]|nr:hypothetical protein [Chloroflexota bacterium]